MRSVLVALSLLVAAGASAEIQLPQASPSTTLVQGVGISKVTVTYHRPAVKGRKVWGDLVPYGQVWRLGANNATTLELSHDAKIQGQAVPAGKYSLFAIPAQNEWTYIVNKQHAQWGAYFYKQDQDLVRFTVKPEAVPFQERFSIDLVPVSDRVLRAEVAWESVRAPFTIEFDTGALVWKQIEERLAKADATWEDFHQSARYALQTKTRLDDAMKWLDTAMKTESFWNYELRGQILHELGRDAEAVPLMLKAKELAKGKAPQEWLDGVDKQIASWRKE
jgi:hypothetical protein